MFSRKNRIPRDVLENIIKQKNALSGEFFNLKNLPNKLDFPRFSVVVSKKVVSSSVKRHLLKRRTYSMLRNYYNSFKSGDFVFFLKKEALSLDFKSQKTALKRFLDQNKIS